MYKNFEQALKVFKAGNISWNMTTIDIQREFVFMLAKSLGKEPGALNTYNFRMYIPEFDNKQLKGLLEKYMDHNKLSTKDALKALKDELDIKEILKKDIIISSYKNFEEALEIFKAGNISWNMTTIDIQREFVFMLAKSLGKEPGALNTNNFATGIFEFNNKRLLGLLNKYTDRRKLSDKDCLKVLKKKLGIENISKAKWQEKKRDWDRVSKILKEIYGLDVTEKHDILNWLRENGLNKEADIALGREIESGNSAARDSLVATHGKTIEYFAGKFHSINPDISKNEFFQEGLMAALRCAERFEPHRNISFKTFVAPRIKGSMLDLIRNTRGLRRKTGNTYQYNSPGPGEDQSEEEAYMANITAGDTPNGGGSEDDKGETIEEGIAKIKAHLKGRVSARNIEIFVSYIRGELMRNIAKKFDLDLSRISQIKKECKNILMDLSQAASPANKKNVPAVNSKFLTAISSDDKLMDNAMNKQAGISLKGKLKTLRDIGIFVSADGKRGYFRFADMMMGPNKDYTRTLINAIAPSINYKGKIPAIRGLVKMAIINEIDKSLAVTNNKTIWHIIEKNVIPRPQQDSLVTRLNKMYRDRPDLTEKIVIVDETSLADEIMRIRSERPDDVIDVALSKESQLSMIPDDSSLPKDRKIRPLIFKCSANFIQPEGVIAALRALHSEDALSTLLRIYSVMAGKLFGNPPGAMMDDPKKFALNLIFDLPEATSIPINDIPKLNERSLEFLAAA